MTIDVSGVTLDIYCYKSKLNVNNAIHQEDFSFGSDGIIQRESIIAAAGERGLGFGDCCS